MNEREVEFKDKQGRKIVGTLLTPDGTSPFPAVIICHGFRGNRNEEHIKEIAEKITDSGLASLRFDFTQDPGKSSLPFESMTVSYELEVLDEALRYIKSLKELDPERIGVAGHSLGGFLSACYTAEHPEIKSLALLSAVYNFRIMFEIAYGKDSRDQVKERGFGESYSSSAGRNVKLKIGFYEDLEKHDMDSVVENLTCPVLVVHGTVDDSVSLDHAQHYFDRSQSQQKELKIIKGADHGYSKHEHLAEVATTVADWFAKTLV